MFDCCAGSGCGDRRTVSPALKPNGHDSAVGYGRRTQVNVCVAPLLFTGPSSSRRWRGGLLAALVVTVSRRRAREDEPSAAFAAVEVVDRVVAALPDSLGFRDRPADERDDRRALPAPALRRR